MGKLVLPLATATERLSITPEAGELLYDETDGHIYEGNGSTVGGAVIGTGERNTNSNAGTSTDGEGLVKDNIGVDTPIKRIKAGTNVTVTSEANDIVLNSTAGGTGVTFLSTQAEYDAKVWSAGDIFIPTSTGILINIPGRPAVITYIIDATGNW